MSASSPHGFVVVRRGYRPAQVDGHVSDLNEERDEANERAARLTLLAGELTEEAERLRRLVTTLPPQTYETLGPRAQEILATAEAEATEVRGDAEAEARGTIEQAEQDGAAVRQTTRDQAERTRDTAENTAVRTVERARAAADALREAARAAAEELRGEADDALAEMTRRCHGLLNDQEKEHTAAGDALDRELGEKETAVEARLAGLDDHGRNLLADAKRVYAETEEAARHRQEDAEAQAAALLAEARATADRVERETDRVLREHEEQAEELRAHMTHVRSSLATLTGRSGDPEAEAPPGTTGEAEPEADPEAEAHLPGQANRAEG